MKEVQEFVDNIYQGLGRNEKENQEIKAEMKNHLLESIYELINDGKSKKDAIQIAIERFGGEIEMQAVLNQPHNTKKTYGRQVLYLSIGFLIFTLTVLWFALSNAAIAGSGRDVPAAKEIQKLIVNKKVLSDKEKQKIGSILNETSNVSELGIYYAKDFFKKDGSIEYGDVSDKKAVFHYKESLWVAQWLGVSLVGAAYTEVGPWYLDITYRSFDGLLQLLVNLGALAYWTLFCIWASINAYHQKRLNMGWIFAFLFFNMVGYFIYRITNRIRPMGKRTNLRL